MVKGIDANDDGVIDFLEFAHAWWRRECSNVEAEFDAEIEMAFSLFDIDGDGMLTVEVRDPV